MNITDEMIQKGSVTIYDDTDKTLIREVEEYNQHLGYCRMKKKQFNEVIFGYAVMNPLVVFCVVSARRTFVSGSFIVGILILIVFAATYFISVINKKNPLLNTAAVTLLIYIDMKFAVLLVADIVIYFMADRLEKALKAEPGYPFFADIHIKFQNGNSADFDE